MKNITFFILSLVIIISSSFSSWAKTDTEEVERGFKGRFMIGIHEIDDVKEICFSDETTTAEDLVSLGSYSSQVEELYLDRCKVDDEVLASLPIFPNLRKLSLRENFVSDKGFAPILRQTRLTDLDLWYNTYITEEALKNLLPIAKALTVLNVGLTQLKDAGMKVVAANFTNLEDLTVSGCELTDSVLEDILSLPKLRRVNIGSNKFTPSALQEFLQKAQKRGISVKS